MLCISRWFTLRPKPSLYENGRALGLSVQISSLYVSLVISSSTLFAKLPYTQPVVSAFASACARLWLVLLFNMCPMVFSYLDYT